MPKEDVDQKKIKVSNIPPPDSSLKQVDEVFIIVTQAYCPNGHNLIEEENQNPEYDFDGYPGLRVHLETSSEGGDVVLSPFHGDDSKRGKTDWKVGTKVKVKCPICKTDLPRLASCRCEEGGDLVKVFLTPALSDSHVMAICNIWGCRRSRTIDNWQIISEYLEGKIED